MAKMSKDELEELQNPETWEDVDAPVQSVTKPPRAIVSVAFSCEDFETIVEAAQQHGMKTSEFIRRATLEKTFPRHTEALVVSVSGGVHDE
jgi:hypothetical protein